MLVLGGCMAVFGLTGAVRFITEGKGIGAVLVGVGVGILGVFIVVGYFVSRDDYRDSSRYPPAR
ncbi:hypothetical protein ACL02U_02510 [Streptomyces sp. MS06]|uniref:hypothetical protein n=1 Tax=Streptomyces sp. MS06 TaxID=3385974 RepID=UPI0039A0046B